MTRHPTSATGHGKPGSEASQRSVLRERNAGVTFTGDRGLLGTGLTLPTPHRSSIHQAGVKGQQRDQWPCRNAPGTSQDFTPPKKGRSTNDYQAEGALRFPHGSTGLRSRRAVPEECLDLGGSAPPWRRRVA